MRSMRLTNSPLRKALPDTLTLMVSGGSRGNMRCHWWVCRHASSSTIQPMGTTSPVSSATSMKVSGFSIPHCGCCQRSSASKPITLPESRETMVW